MKRAAVILAFLPSYLAASPAKKRSADEWYRLGEDHYNLGQFDEAVTAFRSGFAMETRPGSKPAYLFNIAQSYRQAGNCKDATFFYRRYLSVRSEDRARPLEDEVLEKVEGYIATCGRPANSLALKVDKGQIDPSVRSVRRCGADTASSLQRMVSAISYIEVNETTLTLHEGGFSRPASRTIAAGPRRYGFWDNDNQTSTLALTVDGSTHSTGRCSVEFSLIKRPAKGGECTEKWTGLASTTGSGQ